MLAPVVSDSRAVTRRPLIPGEVRVLAVIDLAQLFGLGLEDANAVYDEASDLFVFRQSDGDEDTFAYKIQSDLLYWPVELSQTITDKII